MKVLALAICLSLFGCKSYTAKCYSYSVKRYEKCNHPRHIGYWKSDSSELNSLTYMCICK